MCRCRALPSIAGKLYLQGLREPGRIGCSVRGLGRSRWRVSGARDMTRDLLRASFAIYARVRRMEWRIVHRFSGES